MLIILCNIEFYWFNKEVVGKNDRYLNFIFKILVCCLKSSFVWFNVIFEGF